MGVFDVDAMLEQGTPGLLAEWQSYYELEPFGREWHRASTMTAAIINQIIGSVPREEPIKDSELLEAESFVPGYVDERAQQEIEAQCEAARNLEGYGV